MVENPNPAKELAYVRKLRLAVLANGGSITSVNYWREGGEGQVRAWHLAPANPGRGLVVFAHGAGNDALFPQAHLFMALLQAGYDVFTFDIDGHGAYSSTWLTTNAMSSMLSEALTTARGRCPKGSLHIIGYSLGGALALHTLGQFAKSPLVETLAIKSLCVIAAPHTLKLSWPGLLLELTGPFRRAFAQRLPFYGPYGILPAAGSFKRSAYPLRLAGRKAGLDYAPRLVELFQHLDVLRWSAAVPTDALLIYGGHDRIAPLSQGRELQAVMLHATLQVLPRETHYTTLLSEQTTKIILQFLADHDAS